MELLTIKNLSFTYPDCTVAALRDISFTVEKGAFVTVCGATGSGKSTLLRLLKRELAPLGTLTGEICFEGTAQASLSDAHAAYRIGYVMQRPEQQIVTDKVWHELAFGLENMGVPQAAIARRVAEMASYFGIESWYDRSVTELSGGQKQLLNLAAVMVMQPDLLILDEPTAQLDPIAASDFIATLQKLNRELGLTILITEHRLEELIPVSDKLLILEKGTILDYDTPQAVVGRLGEHPNLLCAMPAAARLYHSLPQEGICPLDVKGGRQMIRARFGNRIRTLPQTTYTHAAASALEFHDVFFRYKRHLPDILAGVTFTVYEQEIFCILGGNGAGKTTTLSVSAGLEHAYSGKVSVFGKPIKSYKNQSLYQNCVAFLPQDVQTVFLKNTVEEELADARAEAAALPYDLSHLYAQHPYDLSGGEQQLVALAKVLATKPRLLLLDEPTKGLDAYAKNKLIDILKNLRTNGMTIVIVTHDVEFTALCADRAAMFFRGNIVSEGIPSAFFAENTFYTTAISRITRDYYDGAVTVDDAARLCMMNAEEGRA